VVADEPGIEDPVQLETYQFPATAVYEFNRDEEYSPLQTKLGSLYRLFCTQTHARRA